MSELMTDTTIAESPVTLTRQEYEQLTRQAPKTITVDAAEYALAVQAKAQLDVLKLEHDRVLGRLRDLETALKREQRDHQEEYNALLKHIKQGAG